MVEERRNDFIEELKKFVGEECIVTDFDGNKFEGVCKAISFQYLNIVLMTKREKIVVKNIANIKRLRTSVGRKKK